MSDLLNKIRSAQVHAAEQAVIDSLPPELKTRPGVQTKAENPTVLGVLANGEVAHRYQLIRGSFNAMKIVRPSFNVDAAMESIDALILHVVNATRSVVEPDKPAADITVGDDVRAYGNGFTVDGQRVDPRRVVVYTSDNGSMVGQVHGEPHTQTPDRIPHAVAIYSVHSSKPQNVKHYDGQDSLSDDGGLGDHWGGTEPLYPLSGFDRVANETLHAYETALNQLGIAPGKPSQRIASLTNRFKQYGREDVSSIEALLNLLTGPHKAMITEALHRALRSWEDPPTLLVQAHDLRIGVPPVAERKVL